MFYIILATAFLGPLFQFLNPLHIFRCLKERNMKNEMEKSSRAIPAAIANSVFEGPQLDLA
jgi:hypothetical protein